MKERFRVMSHQIEYLREEIRERDGDLIRKHTDHVKISNDHNRLKEHLIKMGAQQAQLQQVWGGLRDEVE